MPLNRNTNTDTVCENCEHCGDDLEPYSITRIESENRSKNKTALLMNSSSTTATTTYYRILLTTARSTVHWFKHSNKNINKNQNTRARTITEYQSKANVQSKINRSDPAKAKQTTIPFATQNATTRGHYVCSSMDDISCVNHSAWQYRHNHNHRAGRLAFSTKCYMLKP